MGVIAGSVAQSSKFKYEGRRILQEALVEALILAEAFVSEEVEEYLHLLNQMNRRS